MRVLFCLLLLFSSGLLHSQEGNPKKPEYVVIVNNEISSMQKVDELAAQGLVQGMRKGVTDEEHAKLKKKFGEKIGDKEFVVMIDLHKDKEKIKNQKYAPSTKAAVGSVKPEEEFILNVSDEAADFTVDMLNGSQLTLSDLKGKVVLLNFWATWCAPCLMEFYDMPAKIFRPYNNEQFVFLPISRGEKKELVQKKVDKLKKDGVVFETGLDESSSIWEKFAKNSIPKNFLIDKKGVIRYVSVGNTEGSVDKLAAEIKKLLAE